MRTRLHLTLPELESGASIQVGSKDRIKQLRGLCSQHWPVSIEPIVNHRRKTIASVLLTEALDPTGKGTSLQISFRPVWCLAYTLCSENQINPMAIILEFDTGRKYWIDLNGIKEADVTTFGDGCDPEVVKQAEIRLGEMLFEGEEHPPDILRNAINLIQRSF